MTTTRHMPAFITNTQKISYYDPDSARSTVSVFTEEIKNASQETGFSLFLLAEIRNTQHAENQYFLRELQNTFSRFFVSQQERLTESLFESGLHELNKIIPSLIGQRDPEFINSVSLIAGVISGNVIHFSQVGPLALLFIQGSKIQDIGNRSQLESQNPLKLFKEIASGKIEPNNIVFISTTNFLDYFSQEKIRRLLLEFSDESIAKGFDQYLLQAPVSAAFAAITITVQKGHVISTNEFAERPTTIQKQTPYSRSMEKLIEREQTTEEILTPKFIPFIKRKSRIIFESTKSAFKKYILKKPSRISPILFEKKEPAESPLKYSQKKHSSRVYKIIKSVTRIFRTAWRLLKSTTLKSFSSTKKYTNRFSEKESWTHELAPAVRSSDSRRHRGLLEWFSLLPQKKKLLLVASVLLIAIFAQTIVFAGVRERSQERQQAEEQVRTNIANATAQIDAALLYGDDARIKTALDDLQRELVALEETKDSENLILETQEAIAHAEKRLQKIIEVQDPTRVASYGEIDNSARIIGMTLIHNDVYALDPTLRSLFITQISSGETVSASAITNDEQVPILMTPIGDALYLLNQELSLTRYTPTTKTAVGVGFTQPDTSSNLTAMASYGNRLYFVDTAQNQILRSNLSGGFSRPVNWLFNETPLAQANSMAIDGSIYVGFNNGAVRKFTQGREDTFTLPDISPTLDSIDAIWTSENTNFLYILDGSHSRVIKINKNNSTLQEQLRVPTLGSLDAFAVSESTQQVFVSAQAILYSLPMGQ